MDWNYPPTLEAEFTPPAIAEQTSSRTGRPIRVLLVEDDPEAAELVRIRLNEEGDQAFQVEWRPNLLGGMGRLIEPGIDVVLLDLGLPELNGYKSYQAVALAAGNQVPIVILTADHSRLSRDLVLRFGASDYLLKHESSSHQLRESIRNAVLRGGPGFPENIEN